MNTLRVAPSATAIMHAHAERAFPEECCGILVGQDDDATGRHVVDAWPVDNEKDSERTRRYLIPPDALLHAEKRAREAGVDVVGIYHSHPDHPSRPSTFDRDHAMPFWSYIIVSCMAGKVASTQSWRLHDDRSAFAEETLVEA